MAQLHAATACAGPHVHSWPHTETGYDELFLDLKCGGSILKIESVIW